MFRPIFTAFGLVMMLAASSVSGAERPPVTLYKNPQCGCCEQYANYLRRNGFEVKIVASHNLSLIRRQAGANVPQKLEACHTMLIDSYIVEGHVPVRTLDRLLSERPAIRGISLPGMPEGSPGMTGQKTGTFTIYEIGSDADPRVYAVE